MLNYQRENGDMFDEKRKTMAWFSFFKSSPDTKWDGKMPSQRMITASHFGGSCAGRRQLFPSKNWWFWGFLCEFARGYCQKMIQILQSIYVKLWNLVVKWTWVKPSTNCCMISQDESQLDSSHHQIDPGRNLEIWSTCNLYTTSWKKTGSISWGCQITWFWLSWSYRAIVIIVIFPS